jgi:hypothetical protein
MVRNSSVLIGIEYQCLNSVDIGEEICIVAAGSPLLTVVATKDGTLFPLKFLTLASVTCRSARGVDCFVTHTHTHTNIHTHTPVTYLLLNLKIVSIVLAKIKAIFNIESVGHICGPEIKDSLPPGSSRMSLNPSCPISKSGFLSSIIAYIVLRTSIRSFLGTGIIECSLYWKLEPPGVWRRTAISLGPGVSKNNDFFIFKCGNHSANYPSSHLRKLESAAAPLWVINLSQNCRSLLIEWYSDDQTVKWWAGYVNSSQQGFGWNTVRKESAWKTWT